MSFIWFEINIVVYMHSNKRSKIFAGFLANWEINAVDYLRSRMGILKLVLVLPYYLSHIYPCDVTYNYILYYLILFIFNENSK